MKRIIILLFVLLIVAQAVGQETYVQNRNMATVGWPKDSWYFFDRQETKSAANIAYTDVVYTDTLYTDNYHLYPFNYFECTVEDTNAVDSVYIKVEMWESDLPDTTVFKYVKTLLWSNQAGTTMNSAVIDSAGEWYCDPGNTVYPGLEYFYLKIIALEGTTHHETGVNFVFRGKGHILGQ